MRIHAALVMLAALASLSACGGKAPATVAQEPSSAAPSTSEAASPPASSAPSPSNSTTTPRVVVPAGVTAGIAVFDRKTGAFVSEMNPNTRFRSASLVKLFIALDYLWNRGPDY